MSTTITLDAHYINLHALLHRYFAGSYAVFADFLATPLLQAKNLCQDSIDLVLICLIEQALAGKIPSIRVDKPLQALRFDTHALSSMSVLPLSAILKEKAEPVLHYLAGKHRVDDAFAKKTLAIVATLCVHYVEKLTIDGQLSLKEKTAWLALQPLFLTELKPLGERLGVVLTSPYQDGRRFDDFALDKLSFDGTYPIPNWRWLVTLVMTVQREDELLMQVGGVIDLSPKFLMAKQDTVRPRDFRYGFRLGAISVVVLLVLIAVSVVVWQAMPKNTPPPPTPKSDSQPVLDVAIVRVDDDAGEQSSESDKQMSQPQTSKQTKQDANAETAQKDHYRLGDFVSDDKK